MVGAACTSPHHRADLVRSTADHTSDAAPDPATSTSLATGPGAPDTSAPAVARDNDPTPVLVHAARTTRSSVAVRPAVAVAPRRPAAAPVSTRGSGSPFPTPGPGPEVYAVVIG